MGRPKWTTLSGLERLVIYCQTTSVSIVPHTVPRVGRSYEHFPDGFELHLLPQWITYRLVRPGSTGAVVLKIVAEEDHAPPGVSVSVVWGFGIECMGVRFFLVYGG